MGNKAVLNITKFSLGDSTSMASLLLPTASPGQDVRHYDVVGDLLNVESPIDAFFRGMDGTGTPSANAVFSYVRIIDPNFLNNTFSDDIGIAKERAKEHSNFSNLYGFYSLVGDWLYAIVETATSMYDTSNRVVKLSVLHARINESQEYDTTGVGFSGIVGFYTSCKDALNAMSIMERDSEDAFVSKVTDEELDEFIEMVNGMIDTLNTGSDTFTGYSQMKTDRLESEKGFQDFWQLVGCLAHPDRAKDVEKLFELLRLRANGVKLKEYVASSVEYPYFLDLNLDKATQTDEGDDADGITMHTLEREVSKGDEWMSNHRLGDRLRIRDMFRIDKLNKVSAYESFILSPGHYGVQKDNEMEQEDVVSRLAQDEMTAYGVVGIANTSAGLYFLTEPDDSSSAFSKGTVFSQGSMGVYSTGTFKSFINPLNDRDDYLGISHITPRIGLLRHFGGKSNAYSSGSDFLSWYDSYFNSAVCKRGEVQGKSSLLRIVGKNSYSWFPSKLGVKYLNGVYEEAEYEADEFREVSHKLSSPGLEVKAGLLDDNYEQSVPRCFDIEIPCDENSQYSYLTFDCRLVLHSDLPTAAKEISIEFSLDDNTPIRFFLLNPDKNPENLNEANPLYESVKQYDPELKIRSTISPPNKETPFKFIIENDLATGASHLFHVAITATYSRLSDLVASDDLKKAYESTYVLISRPSIPMQNRDEKITYGDYHAFKTKEGEPIDDFWNLSATLDKASHQHILEVPHNIRMANNSVVSSNYTTASLFSDVLTAKNHMDSEYRMKVSSSNDEFLLDRFRHYTGIDACSDTLSLYYDSDIRSTSSFFRNNADENLAQEYEVQTEESLVADDPHVQDLKYKRIETIKAINRFQHDMKHKSNLFSVRVRNSLVNETLAEAEAAVSAADSFEEQEKALKALDKTKQEVNNVKTLITSAIEKICLDYAPAHNQLFKVYFD